MKKIAFLFLIIFSLFKGFSQIADYPFNGNSNDESGNGLNGTINGATLTTDRFGNPNSAYNFDGVDDHIVIGTQAIINSQLVDFSYSFWLKPDETTPTTSDIIISNYGGLYNGHVIQHNLTGNLEIWSAEASTSYGTQDPTALNLSPWIHYVVTQDANDMNIYKNGQLIATLDVSARNYVPNNTGWPLTFGKANWTNTNYYNGSLDDIKIFNYAISSQQADSIFKAEAPEGLLSNCLIGDFEFNNNANDLSGWGNDGTAAYGASLTNDRYGNPNSAYSVDGVDDFVYMPSDHATNPLTEMSIELWTYWRGSGLDVGFLTSKAIEEFELQTGSALAGNNALRFIPTSGVYMDAPAESFKPNQWNYVVCNYNPSSSLAEMYINGVSVALTNNGGNPTNTALSNTATDLRLGARWNGTFYYDGDIDDVKIRGCVLSATEVDSIWKAGCVPFRDTTLFALCPGTDITLGALTLNTPGIFEYDTLTAANGCDSILTAEIIVGTAGCGSCIVADYPFNGNALDTSGYDNNGTVVGATLTTDRFGNPNSAYSFDGVNDYINLVSVPQLNETDLFTISVWFKTNSSGSYDGFFCRGSANEFYQFRGELNGTGALRLLSRSNPSEDDVQGTINGLDNDEWHQGTWVHEGGNLIKLYVDGVLDNSKTLSTLTQVSENLLLGKLGWSVGNYWYAGAMDDIKIFNCALNAQQIDSIWKRECVPFVTIIDTIICYDATLFVQGAAQSVTGTYYDTLTAVNGCDSIIITNLGVSTIGACAPNTPYRFCIGDTFNLELTAFTGQLQWQSSLDSVNWVDIPGATYAPFQITFTENTYYRAEVLASTCDPFYSEVVLAGESCAGGSSFNCGVDSVQDYQGNWYNTVLIGDQCWLSENLRSQYYADGTPLVDGTAVTIGGDITTKYYFWFNDDSSSYAQDKGAFYTWAAVMNGEISDPDTIGSTQGVCPNNWHVPTHFEWKTLCRSVCVSGNCELDFPFDTITFGNFGTNIEAQALVEGGVSGLDLNYAGLRATGDNYLDWRNDLWTSSKEGTRPNPVLIHTGYNPTEINFGASAANNSGSVRCVGNSNLSSTTGEILLNINQDLFTGIFTTITDPSGPIANDGAIDINVLGGTIPYSYSWSNASTTENISGLSTGTYTVTVTDANNCTLNSNNLTLTGAPCLINTITFGWEDVICNGESSGSISITSTSGTSPYSFAWITGQTTQEITGINAGTYDVTIIDAIGCGGFASIPISEPQLLTISLTPTNPSSFGANDGFAMANVSGGTVGSGYSYQWSNGGSSSIINGLGAGIYDLTVSDGNGCKAYESTTLSDPAAPCALSVSTSQVDILCNGNANGSASITVTNGQSPYSYNWSNGINTDSISNLVAGNYTVTITDNNSCQETASININQPPALIANASGVNTSCGGSDGSVSVTASGGETPYTYSWNNGSTSSSVTGLLAGTYSVNVIDANNCYANGVAQVSTNNGPAISATVTDISCFDQRNGNINIAITGGTAPYDILWSTGEVTQSISGLMEGPYDLEVEDSNGCISLTSYYINEPTELHVATSINNASCGASNGSAVVSVSGGVTPYSYNWSGGNTSSTLNAVYAGIYSLAVGDANGCVVSEQVPISELGAPVINLDTIHSVSCGSTNGAIYTTVSSGMTPYVFNWTNGSTSSSVTGQNIGTYSLTVTGNDGCASYFVDSIGPRPTPSDPICLVTVDSVTQTNLLVWEKIQNQGISHFNVYREGTVPNIYQQIGTVLYNDDSEFVDSVANPAVRSWRYKLTMVDSCGTETDFSMHHKTVHLLMNLGLNESINLLWDHYEGFAFTTYYINRYTDTQGWEIIDSLPNTLTSYSDLTPPIANDIFYVIEVRKEGGCTSSKMAANYSASRSNRPTAMPSPATGVNLPPTPDFTSDLVQVNEGGIVQYTDLSLNSPSTWLWEFQGGTPVTSTAQNPQVTYNTAGVYYSKLVVGNVNGNDSIIALNYIEVINNTSIENLPIENVFDVYPTLTDGSINVFYNSSHKESVRINVIDLQGRIVNNKEVDQIEGASITKLNLSDLSAGSYFVQLLANDVKYQKKIVIR